MNWFRSSSGPSGSRFATATPPRLPPKWPRRVACPIALRSRPDRPDALRRLIQEGLNPICCLLSGGVSVGKYDFVEQVLADLGAEFYFESVALRPGKPLVFGRAAGQVSFWTAG